MKLYKCFVFACAFACALSCAVLSCAEPIETDADASLEIVYSHAGAVYSDQDVSIYRVADVHEDGTFDLCGIFASLPVNIHGIKSKAEWNGVCDTLSAYIAADGIEPDHRGVTDDDGTVVFDTITPGMYLSLPLSIQGEEETVTFESFLVLVPAFQDGEENIYDVSARPKAAIHFSEKDEITYTVVKHWRDNGSTGLRPENIEVDILKNGDTVSSIILNSSNNWSYSWTVPDDGAKWQAVERNTANKYTVTSVINGDTLVITNTLKYESTEAPPMGVDVNTWPYILLMSFSGVILILLAIRIKRSA